MQLDKISATNKKHISSLFPWTCPETAAPSLHLASTFQVSGEICSKITKVTEAFFFLSSLTTIEH